MTTHTMKKSNLNFIYAYLMDAALWAYSFLVLYKIVYVKLIVRERYPEFYWSEPTNCLLLGFIAAAALYPFNGFSIGKRSLGVTPPNYQRALWKTPYILFGLFLLALTFVAGLNMAQVSMTEFFSESGMNGAKSIFSKILSPNLAILERAMFAAVETVYMAFIATIFAIPFAFLVSFFSARNLMNSNLLSFSIYYLARFILNITRAIEPLVWAIIFSVWVGIGPFAGSLALFLHSVASLAKLYSEQIESIDDGPIEAMTATGAHPIQIVWYGVVPQVVLPFLSFTIYRWDINVRMATVIGLVGGGGIGTMLMQYQGLAKWNEVGLLVFVIAAIVWVMDYGSAKIREAIK